MDMGIFDKFSVVLSGLIRVWFDLPDPRNQFLG
jgi:hypothetical protein